MNKILLLSHESDIDGLGCVVLAKLAFTNLDYKLVPNVRSLEMIFQEYLDSKKLEQYDTIFITDLPLIDFAVNNSAEMILKKKVHVFDHHSMSIEDQMNRYAYTKMVAEDEKGKKCGTELFYEYLKDKNLIQSNDSLNEFVELTRLEDTWEWKKSGEKGLKAHDLAILFNSLGVGNYISGMLTKLLNHPTCFSFDVEENYMIQKKKEEYDIFLGSILKNAEYFLDEKNNKFGIVLADYEYRNELAEYIKRIGNPEKIKYFITVALERGTYGQKSYRSIIEEFDVMEVAILHGGGGHKNAAAVNMTEEEQEVALTLSKKEKLKYLAEKK